MGACSRVRINGPGFGWSEGFAAELREQGYIEPSIRNQLGLAVGRPIGVAEVEMVGRCPGQAEKAAMDLHMVTRTDEGQLRRIVRAAVRARHDVMNLQMLA